MNDENVKSILPSLYLNIAKCYEDLNDFGEAEENRKKFIRMDTVGENIGLMNHYQKCGFEFLGLSELKNTEGLPAHYHNATVSLFQIAL